ncbi:hypothetical protein ACWDFL_24555 [Streptomyces bungoensis]
MRRIFSTALLTVAATAAAMTTATAQSPHFIGDVTCTKSLTAGLQCSGKAAGLGNAPTGAFLTAASVEAEYVCVNRGGNIAPGQGTESQNVVGPTRTIQPRNGQITFTNVTIPPPATPFGQGRLPQRQLDRAPPPPDLQRCGAAHPAERHRHPDARPR